MIKKECSERIWQNWHTYNCSKKPIVEKDGKNYCKIHDPAYKANKELERELKYRSECCNKCTYHFTYSYYKYCPLCGNERNK